MCERSTSSSSIEPELSSSNIRLRTPSTSDNIKSLIVVVVVGCAASSVCVEEFVVDTLAAAAAVVSARMVVAEEDSLDIIEEYVFY